MSDCPHCGGFVPEGATHCNECGKPLVDAAPSPAPPEAPPHSAGQPHGPGEVMGIRCPHCGVHVPPRAGFCPDCGKPVGKSCPHCGASVAEGAKACAWCGKAVEEGEGPDAAPVNLRSSTSAPGKTRPIGVLIVAGLCGLSGVWALLVLLALTLGWLDSQHSPFGELYPQVPLYLCILIGGLLEIWFGWQIYSLRNWARRVAIYGSSLGLLFIIPRILSSHPSPPIQGVSAAWAWGLVGLAIGATVLYFLLWDEETVSAFR